MHAVIHVHPSFYIAMSSGCRGGDFRLSNNVDIDVFSENASTIHETSILSQLLS